MQLLTLFPDARMDQADSNLISMEFQDAASMLRHAYPGTGPSAGRREAGRVAGGGKGGAGTRYGAELAMRVRATSE